MALFRTRTYALSLQQDVHYLHAMQESGYVVLHMCAYTLQHCLICSKCLQEISMPEPKDT